MLTPLLIGGGLVVGFLFLRNRNKMVFEVNDLKPGMTGILNGTKQYGMAFINQGGVLGWTNVLPAENARIRSEFPNGAKVSILLGAMGSGKNAKAVADGDGIQGGRFFRAL